MRVLVLLLVITLVGCGQRFEKKEIVFQDLGTVTSVSNCKSSKHSYRCTLKTDKFTWQSIDITDFPYDGVEVGDVLAYETVNEGGSSETKYCRNGQCISHSSCYSWMPCWKNITTNRKE